MHLHNELVVNLNMYLIYMIYNIGNLLFGFKSIMKYHSRTMFYDFYFKLFTSILIDMRFASHFQTPIEKEELRFFFI